MTTAVSTLLHGISQVVFLRSIPAGVILLIGAALASPRTAVLMVIGCAVQSLAAWCLGERELLREGRMGYNGALVGAAASLSLVRLEDTALSIGLTAVGALACVPIHLMMRRLFGSRPLRRFELPVATAPFCLVAGLLFGVLQPIAEPGIATASADAGQAVLLGVLNSFAEVALSDGILPGAVILAAVVAGSWRAGLWAVFGAGLAVVLGLAVTRDLVAVSTGLMGYSAVLAAITLGTLFWAGRPLSQRIVGVVVGVAGAVGLRWILDPTPIPTYTWPFLLALWAVLIVGELLVPRCASAAVVAPGDSD